MSNGIKRTEAAIAAGHIEAYPVRCYTLIKSEAHLLAGADWNLVMSHETLEGLHEMMIASRELISPDLWHVQIMDTEYTGRKRNELA